MENKGARLNILLSMVLFGTISIAVRSAAFPSAVLALSRSAIGCISIVLFSLLKGNRIDFSSIRKNFLLLFVSGVMLGFNWILLFEAYNYTSVAIATLCYYLQPVILIVISPFFLKEKLTIKKILCTLTALSGMVLVSNIFDGGLNSNNRRGVFLALCAAVLYAVLIVCNKKMKPMLSFDRVASQLFFSIPSLLMYVLIKGQFQEVHLTRQSVIWVIITGIVYTGLAYMLFYGSLTYVSSQTAGILSYVDPAIAVLISVILFNEPMSFMMMAGALLILGAAFVSEWKSQ